MRLKCFLLLSFLSISCGPQSVSDLNIMNGATGDERFRATLALTVFGNSLCSASLISPYHAVTARHCVASIRENLSVHAGTDSRKPQESAEVKAVYILPYLDEAPQSSIQLNGESWQAYDVALLELKSPILSVEPYQLIDQAYDWGATLQDFSTLAKKSVFIAGFGATSQEDAVQREGNTLRHHTEVGIHRLDEGVVQVSGDNTGACSGDSGGSLVFPQSESGAFLLGGVLSTGSPCFPGTSVFNTYALIYPNLCWIKKIVNQNANTLDFASHIRCDDAGIVETVQARTVCSGLTKSPDGQTLLDAVAGALHQSDCSQIKEALSQNRDLNLAGLQVRDLSLLQGGRFRKLDLSFNRIDDLSAWEGASITEEINLAQNRVKDLSWIAQSNSLRKLIVDNNQLQEIPANNWKSLTTLRFWNNQVRQIPDLSAMNQLTVLKAGRNRIATVGALPSGLQELRLEQNELTNASFTQELPQLLTLFLYQNRLTSFALSDKANLGWLALEKNQLTSLVLDKLPRLYKLDFSDNPLETIKLGEMPALEILNADNVNFSSVPDLSHLTSLRSLWLRNNRIETLDVEKLPKSLTQLELGWNQIRDISTITALQNLEIVSLHGSPLESLDPLLKLPKLQYVAVDDLDNRFTKVREELKRRGVLVDATGSYGYPEIDFFYLHRDLKAQFPELLTQELSDEEVVFLLGTTAFGQITRNRNWDLPDSFVTALLNEVFEPVGNGRYHLRAEVGQRVFRYAKDFNNYF
ncbi:MAG TPA: trypsin-like serine protease [Oligoflexus sp.]|uniref:trypsin-like serine protease n=1 Tax=Oligoflexus sp. TaxID=1971216 RepID=UPI002D7FD732|nr:trypsin-like serine protease [Oligoflexus sp.]HET9241786.1 trypsin-like serine protease [Oligoflexus sp.]